MPGVPLPQGRCEHAIDVPQARGPIMRRREKPASVRVECYMLDESSMPCDRGRFRFRLDVPDADNIICRSCGEQLVVRTESAVHLLVAFRGDPLDRGQTETSRFLAESFMCLTGNGAP